MLRMMAAMILVYTVVVGAVGWWQVGAEFAAGVLAGGIFSFLNLSLLSVIVKGLLTGTAKPKRFAINLVLKTMFAYGGVGIVIYFKAVEPMPFIIGLTGLVISVFIVGLRWHRTLGN